MDHKRKTLTMDERAQASNPGALVMRPLHWIRHAPFWPVVLGVPLIACIALSPLNSGFFGAAVLLFFVNRFYWARIREHFLYGCVSPGVVVGLNPLRIAVSTDLSSGHGSYPAVKVIQPRLTRIAGQTPTIGMRVATVALYQASPEDLPHWVDFSPLPVDFATGNLAEIRRVRDSITEADWQELDTLLQRVPKPCRPKLYRLWPGA